MRLHFSRVVAAVGILVLAAAFVVGIIAKVRPSLFFRIPDVGFIFYAITGGTIPPNFDYKPFTAEYAAEVVRPGDVVLATAAKAGSLWLRTAVGLLRTGGWDDFENQNDFFGSIEFMLYPEHSTEQRVAEDLAKRERLRQRGIFNHQHTTHACPAAKELVALNPIRNPTVKYIVMVRNGREVVRSLWNFFNSMTPEFRALWGGFPPPDSSPESVVEILTETAPQAYFEHAKSWWAFRDQPNVLLVHFSDLKHFPREVIQRIAQFLEIDLPLQLLDEVVRKSSMAYMSNASNAAKYVFKAGRPGAPVLVVPPGAHVKGGGRSDGAKNFFTPEMEAKWEVCFSRN